MELLFDWLIGIAPIPPSIASMVALFRWKKLSIAGKWLGIACFWALLTELLAIWVGNTWGNNLPLLHLYVPVELTMLTFVFYHAYPRLLPLRWLQVGLAGFWVLSVFNLAFFQPWNTYATITRTAESLLVLLMALRYFFLVLQDLAEIDLPKTFIFWFSTACLLFFSGNLLLFIYSNYVIAGSSVEFSEIWAIHAVLNILLYFVYVIALLCRPERPISARFFW